MTTPDLASGSSGTVAGAIPRPEAAPIQWVAAGIWRRTWAAALDMVGVVVIVVFSAGVVALVAQRAVHDHASTGAFVVASLLWTILFLGPLAYVFLCWRDGVTMGMSALGLRLVAADTGELPSTEQVLLRMVGGFYCALPAGLGFLAVAAAPDRRGWHDRLSGTAVVRARRTPYGWEWNGTEWVWMRTAAASTAPVPNLQRRTATARPERSAWTWSDVIPLLVLFIPAAILSQGLVITALRIVRVGHGHPVAVSLALDAAAYGIDLGLVGLFLGVRRGAHLRDVGLTPPRWPWLLAALPAMILDYAVERPLGELGYGLLPRTPNHQCLAMHTMHGSGLALGLIEAGLLAPVAEEILFRGVLFGWLRGRVPVAVAVVVSAAAFSLGHLDWMEWSILAPTFGAGCLLALLYHYSRSLWPCIVVHGLGNIIAILVVVLGHVRC